MGNNTTYHHHQDLQTITCSSQQVCSLIDTKHKLSALGCPFQMHGLDSYFMASLAHQSQPELPEHCF